MPKLTYHVRGTLIAADSRRPMEGHSIIVETGIRDEASPLCLDGIRTGRLPTNPDGCFEATFYTTGVSLSDHQVAPIPKLIEVHIEFSPGKWRCREVAVRPDHAAEAKGREVWIDLGQIEVDYGACREPVGWEED